MSIAPARLTAIAKASHLTSRSHTRQYAQVVRRQRRGAGGRWQADSAGPSHAQRPGQRPEARRRIEHERLAVESDLYGAIGAAVELWGAPRQQAGKRPTGLSNDLGLFAEEYDVNRKRQVGNFPQAFSHLTLIGAARAISTAAVAETPQRS